VTGGFNKVIRITIDDVFLSGFASIDLCHEKSSVFLVRRMGLPDLLYSFGLLLLVSIWGLLLASRDCQFIQECFPLLV
jgi:hypothetical protein